MVGDLVLQELKDCLQEIENTLELRKKECEELGNGHMWKRSTQYVELLTLKVKMLHAISIMEQVSNAN
jgi:exosome complex RNA-binding protein Rrp4